MGFNSGFKGLKVLWDMLDWSLRGQMSLQRFLFRVFMKQLYLTLQLSEVRLLSCSSFFSPCLFCTFHFIRHLWNSRGSSQSDLLLSRRSFHLAAAAPLYLCGSYASHPDNAITWSQLETVCACQLRVFPSLPPSLPRFIITLNMDGYWRNLVFWGFNKTEWRNTC